MKKVGRPTKYKPEYVEQARVACAELEATDQQLANLFAVDIDTIKEWKKVHPEFSATINEAKEIADRKVEKSLFDRANGYSHEAVKIFCSKDGDVTEVPYIERYPPDPTAMIFWLKNRQRDRWRDKQDHEITGKDGQPLAVINFGTPANK